MQSILTQILGESVSPSPVATARDLRESIVRSLPNFVEGAQAFTGCLRDLQALLDALRMTPESEFARATWQAALPELRRMRDELNAVEHALTPPKPVTHVRGRKKNRRTH